MKKLLTKKLTAILLFSMVLFIVTSCEPVDLLRYQVEEDKEEEKEASGGFTIKDWEVVVDSTIYDLVPVKKTY